MSISITDVNYSYPIAPTIGSEEISATQEIDNKKNIDGIYDAYNNLFTDYRSKADSLLDTVNSVLGRTTESTKISFKNLKNSEDIAAIFDEDDIISNALAGNEYLESKEGLKAYKFYLKEVLTKLCDLHKIIDGITTDDPSEKTATNALNALKNLTAVTEEMLNDKAHTLISELQIYDKQVQNILKAFTEYSVVKNLTVTKNIKYNDGISNRMEKVDHRTYECIETSYRSLDNLIDKTNVLDRKVYEYKHPSWLVSEIGNKWLLSSEGSEWLKTDVAWTWLVNNYETYSREGKAWLQTEDGVNWLNTDTGKAWSEETMVLTNLTKMTYLYIPFTVFEQKNTTKHVYTIPLIIKLMKKMVIKLPIN